LHLRHQGEIACGADPNRLNFQAVRRLWHDLKKAAVNAAFFSAETRVEIVSGLS
jgi:hypothetical protein